MTIPDRMRILVTGGAGYLGSEVAARAARRGGDVLVTALHREPPIGHALRVDLRDAVATTRVIASACPAVVVHTAYRQPAPMLQGDVVDATRNVATATAAVGARLIHLSTDLVFDGEREGRYTEEDEPRPVSRYGAAKLESERIVSELAPDALIVRTSLLYGKPGAQEALALRDDVVFYTDEIRTPMHVTDLADALLEFAEGEVRGILHLAGPEALSRLDFARLLAAAQGRDPSQLRGAPCPAGERARNVALNSGKAAALLRARPRAVEEALHSL